MTYQHAIAEIIDTYKRGDVLQIALKLDWIPSAPVAPASLYSLDETHERVLDLHRLVKRTEDVLTFQSLGIEAAPLSPGRTYSFITWWAPWQLELAQNTSRIWHKQTFAATDMVFFGAKRGHAARKAGGEGTIGEGTLTKDGWDHEHCSLCWKTISAGEGRLAEGYTDGVDWLCGACYDLYVVSGFGKELGEHLQ